MDEETWNPLEVRDLMNRVASGVDPEETTEWEQVAPRQIDGADLLRFEGYVTEILTAFGLQLDTARDPAHAHAVSEGAPRRHRRLRGRPQADDRFPRGASLRP